jgi:tellurium resistance protein TerD
MAISLQKGQRAGIDAPKFTIGLGWDTNSAATGAAFDLDASIFILGENGKLVSDKHFVYYGNLKSADGAVEHTGDNLTGDGDDEQIKVDLSRISPEAASINVVVTIYEGAERKQNFGQVRNSVIRIFDPSTNAEILKYELDEDFSVETSIEFGRIYKRNGEWKFEAMGTGMKGGLQEYLSKYS